MDGWNERIMKRFALFTFLAGSAIAGTLPFEIATGRYIGFTARLCSVARSRADRGAANLFSTSES